MIVDFLKLCSYDVDSFEAVFVESEIFVLWYASCPKKIIILTERLSQTRELRREFFFIYR